MDVGQTLLHDAEQRQLRIEVKPAQLRIDPGAYVDTAALAESLDGPKTPKPLAYN